MKQVLAVAYASTYYSVKPHCSTTIFWFIDRILYTELALMLLPWNYYASKRLLYLAEHLHIYKIV